VLPSSGEPSRADRAELLEQGGVYVKEKFAKNVAGFGHGVGALGGGQHEEEAMLTRWSAVKDGEGITFSARYAWVFERVFALQLPLCGV
jgi:hypothetical protein